MADFQSTLAALAATPWGVLIVLVATVIDGFFPPIPSETAIIGVSAMLAATGQGGWLALVYLAAVLGAFTGDSIAFAIGRRFDLTRLPGLRGPRGRRALEWARQGLERQGGPIIVAGRYIPAARVAVSMSAGSVGFGYRRFAAFDAVAVALWGGYTMAIGMLAGAWAQDHPLLGAVVGIVIGAVIGALLGRFLARRSRGGGQ